MHETIVKEQKKILKKLQKRFFLRKSIREAIIKRKNLKNDD